jgi:bifunctional non-homologous end joining protein LigD
LQSAVLDGEVVAVDSEGHVSFQMLQNRAKLPAGWRLLYYAFDLLYLDGKDMRLMPLRKRREMLERILRGSPVKFSAALKGSSDVVINAVREHGMEGIVAKQDSSRYESGERSGAWRKLPLKQKDSSREGFVSTAPERVGRGILRLRKRGPGVCSFLEEFLENGAEIYASKIIEDVLEFLPADSYNSVND